MIVWGAIGAELLKNILVKTNINHGVDCDKKNEQIFN